MAMPPTTTAAPAPADDDASGAASPTDGSGADDGGDTDQSGPTIIATIMMNADGTFVLHKGDEPDADDGSGAADASGAGADDADQGQTYDSLGALLKGVMDCVKEAQDAGPGSDQSNFEAGFNGDSSGASATPAKAPGGY